MNNRILAVSWSMPPEVTPRSLQVSALLSGLADLEWDIDVLSRDYTVKELGHIFMDTALAARQARKFRVHALTQGVPPASLAEKIIKRLRPSIRPRFFDWADNAIVAARECIRKTPPACLLTFAQPFQDHLIGLRIKKEFPSLPWLAHFSDPWVDNPYAQTEPGEREKERSVIEHADRVVFTTERTLKLVMRKYPVDWKEKCCVLPHCFDPDCYVPKQALPASSVLRILHTGNLYSRRLPVALLCALAQLYKEGETGIHVRIMGNVEKSFQELAASFHLEAILSIEPPVTHEVCRGAAGDAHVLLACDAAAEESVFLPSKLMNYLEAGLPIMALTPENGSTADFLKEVGGIFVPPDDVQAIAHCLKDLRARCRAGNLYSLRPDFEAIQKYTIMSVATRFDSLLQSMSGQPYLPH